MENIVIIDCGSQFTQLIARRIREMHVHSEIIPAGCTLDEVKSRQPKGLIISGGPKSVLDQGSPRVPDGFFYLGVPILGVCYGMQLMARLFGGVVRRSKAREYGRGHVSIQDKSCAIFAGLPDSFQVWMSHGDDVEKIPPDFVLTAQSDDGVVAGFRSKDGRFNALQYHPEVAHTQGGEKMLHNFIYDICGCKGDWQLGDWISIAQADIDAKVGNDKVICGLSGGVDSSVAAALVSRAIGDRLECIFVNNGLLRQNEAEEVLESYKQMKLNVHYVDASEQFLSALTGVIEPERKRKIIGETFIRVFEDQARKIKGARWLLQGTLYPDVIESGARKGADVIKSHHNVGGLPQDMNMNLLEPLRDLFKDEVRALGRLLGLPENIVRRHPFPGPGLAVRCLGDITKEKLNVLRQADHIFLEEIRAAGLYDQIWQAFAVLLPVFTVGVMGDERTYARVCALRAITSSDGMTAEWYPMSHSVLDRVSTRICNEVRGINRVVYDCTSKPPATVEWE
ncbi:GMP synthase (glutamine-hydrolyzing) [Jonquetella anthropi DSM 22815]|uniref:GMP synthase [glutamine-hydrolyzing] n=1 Tax=Jonquetella anthropi DSM 22815 TaxID=885272 RepID=H0UIE5_9BACT|nr:glutamine-hydrolyzing GMP synthase [Jonquetella anthropi]EHM12653.1 GMP synthase (glutamine-hydrolyzing) [Jonquetella anthropi DSM 22815]